MSNIDDWAIDLKDAITKNLHPGTHRPHTDFITRERLEEIWSSHRPSCASLFKAVPCLNRDGVLQQYLQIFSTLIYIGYQEWRDIPDLIDKESCFDDAHLPFDDALTEKFFKSSPGRLWWDFCHYQNIFCPIIIQIGKSIVAKPRQRLPVLSEVCIGSGTYGSVWKARIEPDCYRNFRHGRWEPYQHSEVAIKRFTQSMDGRAEQSILERLFREEIRHARIVRSLASIEIPYRDSPQSEYHIVFELLDLDLHKFLEQDSHPELEINPDQVSPYELLRQMQGLANALTFLHDTQNLCHLDLKPDNILIASKEGHPLGHWRITDFGIADFLMANAAAEEFHDGSEAAPDELVVCDIQFFSHVLMHVVIYAIGGKDAVAYLRSLDDATYSRYHTTTWTSRSKRLTNETILFFQIILTDSAAPDWLTKCWKILENTLRNSSESVLAAHELESKLKDIVNNSAIPRVNVWSKFDAALAKAQADVTALVERSHIQGQTPVEPTPSESNNAGEGSSIALLPESTMVQILSDAPVQRIRSHEVTSHAPQTADPENSMNTAVSPGPLNLDQEDYDQSPPCTPVVPHRRSTFSDDSADKSVHCVHVASNGPVVGFASGTGAQYIAKDDFASESESPARIIPGSGGIRWDKLQVTREFALMVREKDQEKRVTYKAQLHKLVESANQRHLCEWDSIFPDSVPPYQVEISNSEKLAVRYANRLLVYSFYHNQPVLNFATPTSPSEDPEDLLAITFDTSGRHLLAFSWQHWFLWDLNAEDIKRSIRQRRHDCAMRDFGQQNLSLLLLNGGRTFIVYDKGERLVCRFIETQSRYQSTTVKLKERPVDLRLSPDGKQLVYLANPRRGFFSSPQPSIYSRSITNGDRLDRELPKFADSCEKHKLSTIKSIEGLSMSVLPSTEGLNKSVVLLASRMKQIEWISLS